MKYNVISNSGSVKELMEKCKSLMDGCIKTAVDTSAIADLDGDMFVLLKETMQMFDDACDLTISLAKQIDEQTEMLQKASNDVEELKKQNEEILRLLKKSKE